MKQSHQHLLKILELLNTHEVLDGASIGDKLKMTRSAIWKAIQKLQSYGVPIESTKGKGYCLEAPCHLLDDKKIKSHLHNKTVELLLLEKTESTNDYLKQQNKHPKHPIACLAEMQTQGKGRLNRSWHSPFAHNIYLSLSYSIQKDMSELSGLSLVVALAIAKAIENSCDLPEPVYVKWPNDIMAQGKKLSGTLIEVEAESHGFCHVIIGIGINVNMQKASKKEIGQSWTSLQQLTGHYQNRNILCAELINQVIAYVEKFSETGLMSLIKEWNSKDYLFNEALSLQANEKTIKGKGNGINQHGHIVLTLADGSQKVFSSGDATLLKK